MQSSGPWATKGYLVEQEPSGSRIDPTVFYVSLVVVLAFVAWGVLFTDNIAAVTGAVLSYVMTNSAANGDPEFLSSWTIFYWVWWASWGPFVGTFIARISRGRTIREFTFGVLLVPSLVSFVWFAVFGGAAINLDLSGGANIADAVAESQEAALFSTLEQFPLAAVTSFIAIVLVGIFFISGADAASVVMGMLSSRGTLHPKAWNVAMWGVLTGAAATVALLFGGLNGLQTIAILAGAPFALIMIGMVYSLFKALREEKLLSAVVQPGAAPEPGRAMSSPSGAPAPQRMSAKDPREPGSGPYTG